MTISGFFLHAQRDVSQSLYDILVQFACCSSKSSLLDEVDSEMTCPSSAGSCHNKLVLYATGIAVGGIAIGYFIGQQVAKNRARCNYLVKLNTDKVTTLDAK